MLNSFKFKMSAFLVNASNGVFHGFFIRWCFFFVVRKVLANSMFCVCLMLYTVIIDNFIVPVISCGCIQFDLIFMVYTDHIGLNHR